MEENRIPRGKKIGCEDQLVRVYDMKGNVNYEGIWDDCPYKDEEMVWCNKDGCYYIQYGYKVYGL